MKEVKPLAPAAKICIALSAIVPVGALYAPRGIIWIALVTAVSLGYMSLRGRRIGERWPWQITILFLLLLIWGAASWWWSVDPSRSGDTVIDLALILIFTILLFSGGPSFSERENHVFVLVLSASFLVALALLALERVLGAPLAGLLRGVYTSNPEELYSKFNQGLAILCVLLWPATFGLLRLRRKRMASLVAGGTFVLVWVYYGTSISISLTIAVIFFGVSYFYPRRIVRMIALFAGLWILATPWIFGLGTHFFPPERTAQHVDNVSIPHRLAIWRFSSEKIMERPLTGFGIGASRAIPGSQEKQLFKMPSGLQEGAFIPLHPHNIPLQWWLELGLPGAIIGAVIVVWLMIQFTNLEDALARSLFMGQAVTILSISSLSFGAWQSWWLSTIVFGIFLMRAVVRKPQTHVLTCKSVSKT